jgi:hypothetical protein
MSTRAQVRFATREEGVSFSDHPQKIHAQFYCHYDGYPEGLGVEIAECFTKYGKIYSWEIEELTTKHNDLEYIYYVWQHPMKETWISIFKISWTDISGECIFVGKPSNLIDKYKPNTNTDG